MVAPSITTDLHRGRDPGAGASTNYHDVHFKATQTIKVGEEIFIQKKGSWSGGRTELSKSPGSSTPSLTRSPEWLEKNGRCLDNIKPAMSKSRQAGRGAFATRPIKKGKVIAPMPMAHIRRQHLEVYSSSDHSDKNLPARRDGTPLLLNYCYGHPESSLLLFPYSPIVNYVNHNATDFNAELRWSSLPPHRHDWLDRSPDDLASEDLVGLIIEIVATRDIEPGEEVYLNYGEDWDRAWNKFVQKEWAPSDEDKNYVPAEELNRRVEWIKTKSELDKEPYDAKEATTICYLGNNVTIMKSGQGEENSIRKHEWRYTSPQMYENTVHTFPCTIIGRESTVSLDDAVDRSDSVRPIDVRMNAIVQYDDDNLLVTGIPRKAIRFVDRKYSSDMFLRNAFRHEIQIPDHLIPAAWRDLKK